MTQSNELKDQSVDRQISLDDLQSRVQLLSVDPDQPTLEELGKLVRGYRQ